MIVADTCLVVHLFNETELTKIAQKILEKDPYWVLPKIWQEEYANVLSKLARKEKRPIDEVINHFNYTVNEFKNHAFTVDNRKSLRASIEYKISVYDAHFVVLATDFNTVLITEDKEIIKNCPHISMNMKEFLKT